MNDETSLRGSLCGLGGLASLCCVGGASAATAGTAGVAAGTAGSSAGTAGLTAGVVSAVPTLLALALVWFVLARILPTAGGCGR